MTENPSTDEMRNEDEIKHQVLIDNTAQEIFNQLKEIENKREIYEKRWIWELIQNALDATPQDQKVVVEIIKIENQLIFRHNGRPFKPEEVAHLIYHGSTKKGEDIGKFGTGFLTTHLLSRKVKVMGVREDGKSFDFELDRDGGSSNDVKERIEKTWGKYQKSLSVTTDISKHPTEYQYPFSLNSIPSNTVEVGIADLTKIAPYVLAFNDKLKAIKIIEKNRKLEFELVDEKDETGYMRKIIKEMEGQSAVEYELWIFKSDDVEVAIKGKRQNGGIFQIDSLQDIPKIFLAFPLLGTHDLPFPAVINNRKFEPTEKRDAIFLGRENTDDIKRNKSLLNKATELFINLISTLDSNRLENIYTLLKFGQPPEKDWLEKDWYIDLLKKCIVEIQKLRVLKTESEDFISPNEGIIPFFDSLDEEKIKELWDLCCCFSRYKDKMPAREIVFEWAQIIKGWKSLGLDLTKTEIIIEKLVEEVSLYGNLQNFKSKMNQEQDEFEILNNFYKLLIDVQKVRLFDEKNILPDQNGNFKKKPQLHKDEGIDETLKDISGKLYIDLRDQLLHLRVSEDASILLSAKKQEDVIDQIVNKIKQSPTEDSQYIHANIDLFHWLLEYENHLEGYPVLSLKEKTFTQLSRQSSDKLLAPKEVWHETAQLFADLFPQDYVISSVYFERISQRDKWDNLKNLGFLRTDPLYEETGKISSDDLNAILVNSEPEEGHDITADVELSKIAFLEMKDKGIIDTIRKSKDKTQKFLEFLFNHIIKNDSRWDNPVEIDCKCGSKHKIYPALWLGTLKDRSWVPVRKDKSEKPNAQFLAPLIRTDEKLIEKCRQDKSAILLRRLNISISELMMQVVAKDDKIKIELDEAMGSLFSTFMKNPDQLSKMAKLAENESDLFVKEMEERIQNAEEIRRNQDIGKKVEAVIKSVLEKEKEVFKVERTGTGSDFVIKIEIGEKECFLEVKSTSQDYVRMTFPQAKEARDKSDKYVLCVVKLNGLELNEDNIRNGAKFVTDIGRKIQDKVKNVENLKNEQEKIFGAGDIEIEINEGPIRFKINKCIWEDAKTFDQFFTFLLGL